MHVQASWLTTPISVWMRKRPAGLHGFDCQRYVMQCLGVVQRQERNKPWLQIKPNHQGQLS
jgi:hypothetical protein